MKSIVDESLMSKDFHLTEMTIKGKQALIYDNCLSFDIFRQMQNILLNADFPWYYNDGIIPQECKIDKPPVDGYEDGEDVYQFTHTFLRRIAVAGPHRPAVGNDAWSTRTEAILPILDILDSRAWLKVKGNLTPKGPEHKVGGWHCDMVDYAEDGITLAPYKDSTTAILYMNTNDGYTLLETGDKVKSIENRLFLFSNDTLHTGIYQTDTKIRVQISFNFFHRL